MCYDVGAMNPVKLVPDQIRKTLYRMRDLHDDQRALVASALEDLMRQHGEIWPQDLQRTLQHLRAEYKISEIEEKEVFSAIFP